MQGWALSHSVWPIMEKYTMPKMENMAIGIILGAVPVIGCFLAGWWISIALVPESQIF